MANETVTMRYQARDRDEVFTFLRETYPDGYAERLIQQWDWKYTWCEITDPAYGPGTSFGVKDVPGLL